jgi:hypothetical protein
MYNDSTQRHHDNINQIFKQYQEKIEKIKKNENEYNNNDNNNDNNTNNNDNTNDNNNDTSNSNLNTNNNTNDDDNDNNTTNDYDDFKSSKKLWSALVGVHIEDYNFLYSDA